MMKHAAWLLTTFLLLTMLPGCGSDYILRGRVVEGQFGTVQFVPPDDAQLVESPAVASAEISIYRDGGRANQSLAARGRSDAAGTISMPLDFFGVGWMEERWLVVVVRPGHETLETLVTLPKAKRDLRMLVVLREGVSTPPDIGEDLWEEYKRYR